MYVQYIGTRELITAHQSVELVVDGDMSNPASWTLGAGWAIAAGLLTGTATSNDAEQPFATVEGASYDYSLVIANIGFGADLNLALGAGAAPSWSTNGTKTGVVVSGSSTSLGVQLFGTPFDGDVDDVSIKLASGNQWDLEFIGASSDNTYTTDKTDIFSLDNTPQTVVRNSEKITRAVTTNIVIRNSAEWLQFLEFFASVREGEQFTFDEYGTIASPDNPVTVKIIGRESRNRSRTDFFTFSFNMVEV